MKQLDLPDGEKKGPHIWTVSELVTAAGAALEQHLGNLWVEGELSNVKLHGSGHVYFTLKDQTSQVDAVIWRSDARRLRFRLEDGLRVRCHGRPSIYVDRGKFQMYVDRVEPKGLGELQLAFEQLKARLEAEGLFDPARKKQLPFLPRVIGIVTSPSGAAVRDIVRVSMRRFPARFLVAPASVQGDEAPLEIVRAIAWLDVRAEVEVIVVARGGGSLEDLWAFNDERVARAIALCTTPIVSAVGHEVDFTIADFVADLRAPTPSAAGELLVPELTALSTTVDVLRGRLARMMRHAVTDARLRLDDALMRQERATRQVVARRRQRLEQFRTRLVALHPRGRLRTDRGRLQALAARLRASMLVAVTRRRSRFAAFGSKLDALSPLRVLHRGYSLTLDQSGHLVTNPEQVAIGEQVTVRMAAGELDCRVEATRALSEVEQVDARPADSKR